MTNNAAHHYKIEEDVLISAGPEAIQRLGEKGNVIYVNFKQLESLGKDSRQRGHHAAREVLKHITHNGDFDGDKINLKSGGVINLSENLSPEDEERIVHITKDPVTLFQLRRDGKKIEMPQFLVYGKESLEQGLINLDFTGSPTDVKGIEKELLASTDERVLFNNQFISVNENTFYRINMDVSEIKKDSGRFKINNSEKLNLERIKPDEPVPLKVTGFQDRNLRQRLAMHNLVNANIELHCISGGSGSGKSVLTYIAAVNHLLGNNKIRKSGEVKDRIVLFKSNDIIGDKSREQGFLPGSKEEKDWPFMKSYQDAHDLCGIGAAIPFEYMLNGFPVDKESGKKGQIPKVFNRIGEFYLPDRTPPIEVENLIYARGRTFENCIILVDEAQNYTPFEIKQLIERAGIGSVIYLVGDPEQVDNPRLSSTFNGFTYATNIFLRENHPRMSIMNLDKNYRLQSAEIIRRHRAPEE